MKRIYLLAFLLPMALQGQTFTETPMGLKNFFYSSSDIGDINNDGKPDLVYNGQLDHDNDGYTDEVFNEIYVNSNGSYNGFWDISADATQGGDIRFIDFNNDGLQDIISVGLGAGNFKHYRFENNGSGFTKVSDEAGKASNPAMDVFDFNHDGLLDYGITGAVYAGGFATDISYFENSGNGFNQTPKWLPGAARGSFKVLDLNNDMLLDLAVLGYNANGEALFKTYLNINGTLQFSQDLTPLGRGEMNFADFNADGFQDLVAIGWDLNFDRYLGVFINDGAGSFTAHPIASEGLLDSSVDVGDLNNDGYYDFAVIGDKTSDEGAVNVFTYDPASAAFIKASGTSLYNLGGSGDLKLVDFDGDNHLDVLTTGADWQNLVSAGSPPFLTKIYKNNSAQPNQKPTAPTNLNVTKNGTRFDFTWSGATDDKTPVNSLQYEIKVGTTPGAQDLAKYTVTTPSWFLELDPSIQDVYWSVQTIDAAKAHSDSSVQSSNLGVNDSVTDASLLLYPNPASEKVFIKGEKISDAELYSTDGKKLNVELDRDQSINVSGLPKGMYMLKVKIKDHWISKKLIIK